VTTDQEIDQLEVLIKGIGAGELVSNALMKSGRNNPTTIHVQNYLRSFFSSGVISRRGDFGVDATQPVQ
jgi:hypothetical protein